MSAHNDQLRDRIGRFGPRQRDEDDITLAPSATPVDGIDRTDLEYAAHIAGGQGKEPPIMSTNTNTNIFEIDDSAYQLPDETYAVLHAAKQTATPEHRAVLEELQYAWLSATGGVGSPLDDRVAFQGFLSETVIFLTPEGDRIVVPVAHADEVPAKYRAIHGLAVSSTPQGLQIEMVEWGDLA